jgi:D-alanyl-D-alanine carboxypeptidase (penicillin-binding protein 5/6)
MVSGNDAAVALADAAASSEQRFVSKMNATAERLGLKHTSYANPIGLDQAGNYSTARDLARLAVIERDDKVLRRIFDTAEYDTQSGMRSRHLVNRNLLVLSEPWVNGVKTGYTGDAGYVLVGAGKRKGVELVSAVLGSPSEAGRDQATLDLLDYGFSLYDRKHAVEEGDRLASAEVSYQDVTMPLLAKHAVSLAARDDQDVEVAVDAPAEVAGPIDRGERLGQATVTLDGELVDRVPLLAARAVGEASVVQRLDSAIPGPRPVLVILVLVVLAGAVAAVVAVVRRQRRLPG